MMDFVENVFFNSVARYRNDLLYNAENALKMIELCKKFNIDIYSFEMLKLYGYVNTSGEAIGFIRPNMALDWSAKLKNFSTDVWTEAKVQVLKRSELCKLGYFFDIVYDSDKARNYISYEKMGIDYLYEEFSKIVAIKDSILLYFYFEDLNKVIKRCREFNLPIYGIYALDLSNISHDDPTNLRFERELKYDAYFGDNWFMVDTWRATLQHLDSIESEVKGKNLVFNIVYHNCWIR